MTAIERMEKTIAAEPSQRKREEMRRVLRNTIKSMEGKG